MCLFDFLKKNKNIITENGLNKIYYDDGKGPIKEEFSKIKGLLNGEYIKYNRNGTFELKTYKDGLICLTDEQILENKKREEQHKKIDVEIMKLSVIDEMISEITGLHLLVQMENSTIDYYAELIEKKFNYPSDGDYIKFYLYSKRNYFIKDIIEYNFQPLIEIDKATKDFNETNIYNLKFSKHIENYIDDLKKQDINLGIKFNYSDSYFIKSAILRELFLKDKTNKEITSKISIYYDGRGINKDIFNQQSILFGLNFNTYSLIHDIIEKKANEYSSKVENFEIDPSDLFERVFKGDELDPIILAHQEIFVQKVMVEIESLCNENKFNQNDFIFPY